MGTSGTHCTLEPNAVNLSSQRVEFYVEYSLSQYDVVFNKTTGDYNLDNLIICFNPTYDPDIVFQLQIQCNSVSVPEHEVNPPIQIYNYITNYKLLIDIRTVSCQLGEFLNQASGGCVLFDTFQNQYQVSRTAQNCSDKDDSKIKSLESAMIELREHYWRSYYFIETIEYCYHLVENCMGGWKPDDESCILGHIGALCEGNGSYSVSSDYSCESYDDIAQNVITIILLTLCTLISTLITVRSTIQIINELLKELSLKAFRVRAAIKNAQVAIFIKVFTNYLQIISTITPFQLQIPVGLTSVFSCVGNPISTLAYSLDCFLVNLTDLLIIYFRIIWSLIMTTSYITPNLIGGIISLSSYRKILDEYLIQGNVAQRYDRIEFNVLIFGGILPFILWHGVYKNRNQLDESQVRKMWGYLYNEHGKEAYFWETLKIMQKLILMILQSISSIPCAVWLMFNNNQAQTIYNWIIKSNCHIINNSLCWFTKNNIQNSYFQKVDVDNNGPDDMPKCILKLS